MKEWLSRLSSKFKKDKNSEKIQQTAQDTPRSDLPDNEEVPNDGDSTGKPHKWVLINKKKPWSLRKKIIVISVSVIAAVILGIVAYFLPSLIDPMGQFESVAEQLTPPPTQTGSETPGLTPTPEPTLNPYEQLIAQGDFDILKDTVNIMLIGVDYAPERDESNEEWTGKHDYHSDVMIVLAINTRTNDVNLISLPRDTYANIPEVSGIYKLNASIDCGGGWPTESGFKKVCEAASWMIGEIPINYYYAVDMTAVKGLVDAIGGVDFEVDIDFIQQGRSYSKGFQHMDGQSVLDYLRVRKEKNSSHGGIINPTSEQLGDTNRVIRQKNMLIAIFEKLKQSGLIFKIPDILGAFDGNLYTNTTLAQSAAIAAYAYNVDSDKIKMHSMTGDPESIFGWNFQLTYQSKRVKLIKEIYGVDVSQSKKYSYEGAYELWQNMQIEVTGEASRNVLEQVKSILDADAALPPYPTPTPDPTPSPTPSPTDEPTPDPSSSASPSPTPSPTPMPSPTPTPSPTPSPDPTPSPTPIPSDGFRKYPAEGEVWALYNKTASEYEQLINWDTNNVTKSRVKEFNGLMDQLHADIQSLCAMFAIGIPDWDVYYGDSRHSVNQSYVKNEIYVNFN